MVSRRTDKISDESTDPFQNGDAWRQFLSLEQSLSEFVEYVPLDRRNQNVFSPKLGTILISASTQIEATFKAIINSNYMDKDECVNLSKLEETRKAIKGGRSNMQQYRELLEPYFLLSRRMVTIRQYPKVYRRIPPFRPFRYDKAISWWQSYTDLKHSIYDNIKEATLRRVFSAVAALFLIQVMHLTHRKTLINLGVIRSGHKELGMEGLAPVALAELLGSSPRKVAKNIEYPDIWAETEFFEFDFYSL